MGVNGGMKRMKDSYSMRYLTVTISVIAKTNIIDWNAFESLGHRLDTERTFDTFRNSIHAGRSCAHGGLHTQV